MTIHRPGLPGDLPAAELLWARWALVAVLQATTGAESRGVHRTGLWLDADGLHFDDSGCTWWALERRGEGRYVLYGEDESSEVKWHKPAVDMLAQGPDWLPYETLRDLLEGWELGCVYWYENGAWARAPYPGELGDDGLDCGMSRFVDPGEALSMVAEVDRGPGRLDGPTAARLLAAAEDYRLTPEDLAALPDGDWDLSAMLRALDLAGLSGACATPVPPAR
ncbi:hypothetical protein [Streptomyces sp. NBC_01565]|uniref:hypothetical protein n=1 Tax=unclassified Streptomyces TaxID=2593676 RepID=UPI00224F9368|nr:hypothetical protein [Streptomyces sp. NBC_01565]MCX4545615.1 hypothetical protein [Streptomyces sp. NBC_01565]